MVAMANNLLHEQLGDVSTNDARKGVPQRLAEGVTEGMASLQGFSSTSATPVSPSQDAPMPRPPPPPTSACARSSPSGCA
jgi:hypothetical protein